MEYLNNLEQKVVLESIKVINDYDMSNFTANAKMALTHNPEQMNIKTSFSNYITILEKAIQSFSDIKLEKGLVKEFIAKINSSPSLNYNFTTKDINMDEISVFKPQYMDQYIVLVQKMINDLINHDITVNDGYKFIGQNLHHKVEQQIVKTNLPYGVTNKELKNETRGNVKFVTADINFIKEKVIPFVTKYDSIKSKTLVEAESVLNAIKEANKSVEAMNSALNKYREASSDISTIKDVNMFSFNAIRSIMELVSYVSFMMVHKLNTISTNVISCNRIYTDVFNGTETTETAFDRFVINTDDYTTGTELIEGDSSAYEVLSNNIYEYHIGMLSNPINDVDDILRIDYPKDIYDEIVKAYIIISEGLNILGREGDDYLLIFDDLINKSGFSIVLKDRFREVINAINDLSMYRVDVNYSVSPDVNMYMMALHEVKCYGDNMQAIANTCHETYNKLAMLQERFANNVNGEFKDLETTNELKVFMKDLREQYVDMTNCIASNFMSRLKNIGDALAKMDSSVDGNATVDDAIPIDTTSDIDFSEATFHLDVEMLEDMYKEQFNEIQKAYVKARKYITEGFNVVFEAEVQQATATSTNDQNQKPSTKPVVIDGSGSNKTTSNTLNNISTNVDKFFNEIRDNITSSIDKNEKQNMDFINNNKENLMNRSYSNVTVQCLPYNSAPIKSATDDMTKVVMNIKSINPQTIQSIKTEDDVYKKLFPFIPGLKADGDIKGQISNFYTTGNVNSVPQNTSFSNSELSNVVTNDIIPSCETHYTNTKNALNEFTKNAQDSLDNSIKSLNTGNPNNYGNLNETQPQPVVKAESVELFMEEPAPNTETSMGQKMRWVVSAVKNYTNAVSDSLQKRNNDYFKILNSLRTEPSPSKPAAKKDGNDQPFNRPIPEKKQITRADAPV